MSQSTVCNSNESLKIKKIKKSLNKNKISPKFLIVKPEIKKNGQHENKSKIIKLDEVNFKLSESLKIEFIKDPDAIDRLFNLKKYIKIKKKTFI